MPREDLTYDSPSAFLEAIDYPENAAMQTDMLQYNQPPHFNAFKQTSRMSGPIDPQLSTFNDFNLGTNFWNEPAQYGGLGNINPTLSPLDGNQSCDTGYVSQDGTTPDKSPHAMMNPPPFSNDIAVDPSSTQTKARKRSSTKSNSSRMQQPKAPTRKARRTSKAASVDMTIEDDEEDDEKREQFLARNREAASKCRQKKKEWTQGLEERARELSSQKQMLTTYLAMLKNELLMLKCKCLEHSDCGCEAIRDYLKGTVTNMNPASAQLYNKLENKNADSISSEIARKQSSMGIDQLTSPVEDSSMTPGSDAIDPEMAFLAARSPVLPTAAGQS